jgi:chromosome segregation ATPase
MSSRALPILNAIGCLMLTTVVLVQWRKERAIDGDRLALKSELATWKQQAADEVQKRGALERDIVVLKESIASTQLAAESSAKTIAEKAELTNRLETDLNAAREQVSSWETAIKERDERIRTLDAELAATRKRLDEAIAKLKAAGAR